MLLAYGPLPAGLVLGTIALFGLLLGSFLNVVIARLPAQVLAADRAGALTDRPPGLAWPPSHCPDCKAPIRWFHNIPLLGFTLLRGRCADCGGAIAWRYPLIELAGMACLLLPAALAVDSGAAVAGALLLLLLLALAVIDLETGLLPDRLTLPGLFAGLLAAPLLLDIPLASAALGAAVGYSGFRLLDLGYRLLRGRPGMGGGDAKLAAMIGAWLGWQALLPALLCAFALGTLAALVVMTARRSGSPAQSLPFGPALAAGAAIGHFFGAELLAWYATQALGMGSLP